MEQTKEKDGREKSKEKSKRVIQYDELIQKTENRKQSWKKPEKTKSEIRNTYKVKRRYEKRKETLANCAKIENESPEQREFLSRRLNEKMGNMESVELRNK